MKIVCVADTHQRESAWPSRGICGDAEDSLNQIASYVERHITPDERWAVILAGDIFDKRSNRAASVNVLMWFVTRLQKIDVPVYYIQGQHDMDTPPWLAAHPHAEHISRKQVTLGKWNIVGLDYCDAEGLQEFLKTCCLDKCDLLVTHQVWGEFMGELCSPQGRFADIPSVSLLLTGDFHKTIDAEFNNRDGKPIRVLSPGATCMQKIDEDPLKYFFVICGEPTDYEVVKVRLKTRIVIPTAGVVTTEEVEELIRNIPNILARTQEAGKKLSDAVRKPLWRISYSKDIEIEMRRIEKAVGDGAYLFLTPVAREKEVVEVDMSEAEVGATPRSLLPQLVDKEKQPKLFDLCDNLLNTQGKHDVRQSLEKFKTEFMNEYEGV